MDTGETNMPSDKINLMPAEIEKILYDQFNVIGRTDFKEFDLNLNNLRNFFDKTKKERYDILDRYIIVHQDTDIYIDEMCVGLNLRNFFLIAEEFDLPLYTFIIWTNHFGLQKEIDIICKKKHPKDRPTLIESFCTVSHVAEHYRPVNLDLNQIEYHAISMMGAGRSHRFALYNNLKDLDPTKIAITISPYK